MFHQLFNNRTRLNHFCFNLDQETSSILYDNSSLRFSDSEMSTPHNTPLSTRKLLEVEQNEGKFLLIFFYGVRIICLKTENAGGV